MPKLTKTTTSKLAVPAKTEAKKPVKSAATPAAKGKTGKAKKPEVATRPTKERAAKSSTPAPARRKPKVSAEQHRRYVEVAAYFMAERHGFTPGREQADWVAAEAEIDRMIAEGLLSKK